MDILVAHPYKHHAFHLAAGCVATGAEVKVAFPLYKKGLGKLVSFFPGVIGKKASGYFYDQLPIDTISSNLYWQTRKLYSFFSHPRSIEKNYDLAISKKISNGVWQPKVLVTLQDHMSQTVAAAKERGITIWSDQILNMADSTQIRLERHSCDVGIDYKWFNESRNNSVLACADIITVATNYVKDGLLDRVRDDVVFEIVPYGVDTNKFSLSKSERTDEILIVARANSVRKGGHLLISALNKRAHQLSEMSRGKKVKIFFLGEIDKNLQGLFNSIKIPPKFSIDSGNIPFSEVPKLLGRADLFVMPTLSEGMSLAIAEAMSCGLPIITTKFSGVDYFADGVNGILVEDNVDSLGDGLVKAFSFVDKWPTWGRASRDSAAIYDWSFYEKEITRVAKIAMGLKKK